MDQLFEAHDAISEILRFEPELLTDMDLDGNDQNDRPLEA
jgi:hypothetical protein